MAKDKTENNQIAESNAITDDSFEQVAKDAGMKPEQALDYRNVDQGRNVEPKLTNTAEAKDKGKKGKDKGKESKSKVKRTIRDEAVCGGCGNSMTQSEEMNWHALEGVKLPKKYKSPPGAPSGKASGVFCDTCEAISDRKDFRTAVVEREDGTIANVPITDLVA